MTSHTALELADHIRGVVDGDPDRSITGVAALTEAGPGDVTFFAAPTSDTGIGTHRVTEREAYASSAGVLVVSEDFERRTLDATLVRVEDPRLAFVDLLSLFEAPPLGEPQIHSSVVLGLDARLGEDVDLAPGVVVGPNAEIGDGTRVGANSVIDADVRVGADCRIGPNVTLHRGVELGDRVFVQSGTRIGTDGFGYVPTTQGARRVPQVGGCVLEDEVELGANCTIDRGALGDTRIGARTKIDNLVHVAHNVDIGPDCIIVAQVGIAGSTTVARGVQMGGQAGLVGHITIGAGARIAAQSGVISDVPDGATYGGSPARPHTLWMRANAAAMRLPALVRRVAALEQRRTDVDEEVSAPEDR